MAETFTLSDEQKNKLKELGIENFDDIKSTADYDAIVQKASENDNKNNDKHNTNETKNKEQKNGDQKDPLKINVEEPTPEPTTNIADWAKAKDAYYSKLAQEGKIQNYQWDKSKEGFYASVNGANIHYKDQDNVSVSPKADYKLFNAMLNEPDNKGRPIEFPENAPKEFATKLYAACVLNGNPMQGAIPKELDEATLQSCGLTAEQIAKVKAFGNQQKPNTNQNNNENTTPDFNKNKTDKLNSEISKLDKQTQKLQAQKDSMESELKQKYSNFDHITYDINGLPNMMDKDGKIVTPSNEDINKLALYATLNNQHTELSKISQLNKDLKKLYDDGKVKDEGIKNKDLYQIITKGEPEDVKTAQDLKKQIETANKQKGNKDLDIIKTRAKAFTDLQNSGKIKIETIDNKPQITGDPASVELATRYMKEMAFVKESHNGHRDWISQYVETKKAAIHSTLSTEQKANYDTKEKDRQAKRDARDLIMAKRMGLVEIKAGDKDLNGNEIKRFTNKEKQDAYKNTPNEIMKRVNDKYGRG